VGFAALSPPYKKYQALSHLGCVCESLQCAIDCWPKSPQRRFAANNFEIKTFRFPTLARLLRINSAIALDLLLRPD